MGWFEFPVCCSHCGEPQSTSPRWTPGNCIKSIVEVAASLLIGFLIQDAPEIGPFSRSFRCRYCGRVFQCTPNEAYRKQRSTTRCRNCDYSLIGNKTGICPECGERT